VAIWPMVSFSIVSTVFAQGNLLGYLFFLFHVPPLGRSLDIYKASASIEENCILIILHFTALASS